MTLENSGTPSCWLLLQLVGAEAAFSSFFALILLKSTARATKRRITGVAILGAVTYTMEQWIVAICLASGRVAWAATAASLLWTQFLSASELALVSRVDASTLPAENGPFGAAASAAGLLLNMRRVGTQWQVKNVPSTAGLQTQTRTAFVLRRAAVTLIAYLFVDVVVSMPPPDLALVQVDKATLFSLHTLTVEDVIFRFIMTVSYWITTGTLILFMNNMGAIVSVLLHLSKPADCPPLFGSFSEAYTVRRFWG